MKLNYKRTVFIGMAFLSISAFWQLYDNIIPLILANTFNLSETMTGSIMAIDNVLALIMLPIFGSLSDKVDSKYGKRTPFIVIGTIIAATFTLVIPIADNRESLPLFIIALGVTLLAMSSYRAPAVALMPDLTPKPLRSKANAVINLMGALGAVVSLISITLLVNKVDKPNYIPVFMVISLLMIISILILVFTINENKLKSKFDFLEKDNNYSEESIVENDSMPANLKRSLYLLLLSIFLWFTAYNAVTTAFSRYAVKVWGLQGGEFAKAILVATIAAVVSFLPVGFLSTRFGRKKLILSGIVLVSISYFSGIFFQVYSPLINLVFAVMGVGWAMINVNSFPMVVEMSKSGDVGRYTGLYYSFSMAAQIFTPVFSGFLMQNIGYNILFPYALIFSILSFLTMSMVMHGDVKPVKIDRLESFDIDV